MKQQDAIALLQPAVSALSDVSAWADMGAGDGTFTLALAAILGRRSRVVAVDRRTRPLSRLRQRRKASPVGLGAVIDAVQGDLRDPASIPAIRDTILDGVLFSNSLHFVREPGAALAANAALVRTGGVLVVVEYDGRRRSPWIPHPLPPHRLEAAAEAAGLGRPVVVADRPSAYAGTLYCARIVMAPGGEASRARPAPFP